MASARPVEPGFSPLDEELGLLPGRLTPRLHEALVRLSTQYPSFAKAAAELAWFTGTVVHPDTARRQTEAAGAVLVASETAAAEHILRDHPDAPAGPDTLIFSVDGAMVPVVGGQWMEVRTLAVGAVQPPVSNADGVVIQTTDLSYFSRLADSTTFASLATGELHRRGIERARRVGAVVDGAAWCQSFIDYHYGEAVRILDLPHAAEYLTRIGQTVGADGPLLSDTERARLCDALQQSGPTAVLPALRAVVATQPTNPELATQLAYLETRAAQMQYPQFIADGWPIGSGMVESANKLVVEDRLKGAGMHWAPTHVNPLLALRNAICHDRWDERWALIEREQRQQRVDARHARHPKRIAVPASTPPAPTSAPPAPPRTEPVVKPRHPWTYAWSQRRQRELADAA